MYQSHKYVKCICIQWNYQYIFQFIHYAYTLIFKYVNISIKINKIAKELYMRLHRYEASKVLLQNPHLPLLHPLCITMHKNLLLYFVEISKVFGHDRDPLHHVPSGFHRFNHLISVHPKLKLDVAHFKSFLVIFRHFQVGF